jgi:DNA-binding CsgD family transcriptional regulator
MFACSAAAWLWTLSGQCPRFPQMRKTHHLRISALPTALAAPARAIGGGDFYRQFLAVVADGLAADLAMVMRYSTRAAPEYLLYEGLSRVHMDLYLGGLYRVDPIYRLCRKRVGRGVQNLNEFCTPREKSGDYFSIFLRMTGMADDLAILFPAGTHSTMGLVFERSKPFVDGEIRYLKALYPLLEGLHLAHQRYAGVELARSAQQPDIAGERATAAAKSAGLPPIEYARALRLFLRDQLTPREREIIGLIFAGYPNTKIAERLRLSINTIKNHKKRLYAKLDITTERELFMNFVSFLFEGADA